MSRTRGFALRNRPHTLQSASGGPPSSADYRLLVGPAHRSAGAGVPPIREPAQSENLPQTAGLEAFHLTKLAAAAPSSRERPAGLALVVRELHRILGAPPIERQREVHRPCDAAAGKAPADQSG